MLSIHILLQATGTLTHAQDSLKVLQSLKSLEGTEAIEDGHQLPLPIEHNRTEEFLHCLPELSSRTKHLFSITVT